MLRRLWVRAWLRAAWACLQVPVPEAQWHPARLLQLGAWLAGRARHVIYVT